MREQRWVSIEEFPTDGSLIVVTRDDRRDYAFLVRWSNLDGCFYVLEDAYTQAFPAEQFTHFYRLPDLPSEGQVVEATQHPSTRREAELP